MINNPLVKKVLDLNCTTMLDKLLTSPEVIEEVFDVCVRQQIFQLVKPLITAHTLQLGMDLWPKVLEEPSLQILEVFGVLRLGF